MIATLILAGGTISPELQAVADGAANRALIRVGPNGETMLDLVVAAIRSGLAQQSVTTGRILIAGEVPTPPGCVAVPGGASLVDTLLSGVSALHSEETRLLLSTADLPFLTGEAVADFLRRAEAVQPAQFAYPIVDAALCQERFPEMKRTVLRIAEGTFTGGNLALLDPAFLRESESVIRTAYGRRKDVPALARMLGSDIIVRFLISRFAPTLLTIPHLETAVGRILNGGVARAVVTPYPEIGADIDHADQIAIARRILHRSSGVMERKGVD